MKAIDSYFGIFIMVVLAAFSLGAWVHMRLASHLWHLPMIGAMCLLFAWGIYTERDRY